MIAKRRFVSPPNATKYNLDPDHFGVGGDSAGGHLAAMIGTSGEVAELEGDLGDPGVSSRVQAVLDWFGPTDFTQIVEQSDSKSVIKHDAPNSPTARLLGGPVAESWRACPVGQSDRLH